MPMQRDLYPHNWDDIARAVKDAANWTCEWCGRSCRRPGESWEDFQKRMDRDIATDDKPGRYILTVAHLDHEPSNCDASNLKALCSVCHCQYDLRAMGQKRMKKRERLGQLVLDLGI